MLSTVSGTIYVFDQEALGSGILHYAMDLLHLFNTT